MASEQNLILLDKDRYEDLIHKANKSLEELAQENGMNVVSPEVLKELKENAEKPL